MLFLFSNSHRANSSAGKLKDEASLFRNAEEGNTNSVVLHQYKRSTREDDDIINAVPNLMAENMMKNDLMAMSTPAKYREKRSKHSKKSTKKSSKRSEIEHPTNTKDELMNILGAIRTAKHHKLSRNDIRKLAKKAFARFKSKKTNVKGSGKEEKSKKGEQMKSVTKGVGKSEVKGEIKSEPKVGSKVEKQSTKETVSTSDDVKAKDTISTKDASEGITKTAKEDEQAFSNIFDDAVKQKPSEFAEDISKLGDTAKISQMLSDESMTHKIEGLDSSLESMGDKKSTTSSDEQTTKDTSKSIEQELHKEMETKGETSGKSESKSTSKKSSIPASGRDEKIKTLKTLLAKANKSKVPKKFLEQFPAGLRMIAWRELLEKKKKELGELEELQSKEDISKKDKSGDSDDHPVTVNIDIDPNADKNIKATAKLDGGKDKDKSNGSSDKHHVASHVKYLQKHLNSAQDLRKLISRALIGHCKTTGKRILKAFIAMDKALARAQNIATVIGKKFKVDAGKIETIVVNKEDEVVESFLRDIFSNFTPQ